MIQIRTPDDRAAIEPRVFYLNHKAAGRAAARKLGRDWRRLGYTTKEARP